MIKKTVIITGASGEIGKEIALKFAENGYNLALIYNSNPISYCEEFEKIFNIKVKSYKLNLEEKDEIKNIFNTIINNFNYVTTLVNCAGISQKQKLVFEMDNSEINKIININFVGTILCCKEILPHFIKNKFGKIINISSFLANYGCSCESVYSASKSAINTFTKSLALEVGNFNINVNCVSPGFIDTKMNNNLSFEEKEDIKNNTPLQRLGNGNDIANIVYFLSSEEASFITGQNISVDGGLIL